MYIGSVFRRGGISNFLSAVVTGLFELPVAGRPAFPFDIIRYAVWKRESLVENSLEDGKKGVPGVSCWCSFLHELAGR